MKRQVMLIVILCVFTAALIAVYFFALRDNGEEEYIPTDTPIPALIENPGELVRVTYNNNNAVYTLLKRESADESSWYAVERPDLPLSPSAVSLMMTPLRSLRAQEKLLDSADDYAQYGLDNPAFVEAEYADGSVRTVLIGNLTLTGDYYYIQMLGDPAVYLLLRTTGGRLLYGYNDIIDKTLPETDIMSLYYCFIEPKDKNAITMRFIGFEGETDRSSYNTHVNTYGETSMRIFEPISDRAVYIGRLADILEEGGFQGYRLGELIEIECEDFEKYGLDDPELTLIFEDYYGKTSIYQGAYADDDYKNVYVRINDRNSVFLMDSAYLDVFHTLDPIKFVERFILAPLPNIGTVDNIVIESTENYRRNYIEINHLDDEPDPTGVGEIAPIIDGVSVDAGDFRTFYRVLIGLAADAYISDYEISDAPLITVTYNYHTGSASNTIAFYPYDTNYYIAVIDDDDSVFAINKRAVQIMFDSLDKIIAENSA